MKHLLIILLIFFHTIISAQNSVDSNFQGSSTPIIPRGTKEAERAKFPDKVEYALQVAAEKSPAQNILKSASIEKSAVLADLETVNDDMRFSPDWMSWAINDPRFKGWVDHINSTMGTHFSYGGTSDNPAPLAANQDYTLEEKKQMWRLFKEWCATRNAEAKEYQYQAKFALFLTPQAYELMQNENPGVTDPAEWKDIFGLPILDHIRREFDILERTGASSGYNIRIEMIPEFIIIDDPLADEIDQPLPDGKLGKANERLRDEIFEAGLNDPTSKIYKQAKEVADAHGVPVEQLKTVVIAAWGQSAGESYFTHSNDPETSGINRAFGINMNSIGGYNHASQQDGLFATEFFKSVTQAGAQGERAGNNAMEIPVADIRAANGMDDKWEPVGVEGQSDEENGRFFEFVKYGKEIVTCTTSNVLGAKLQALSNPDLIVPIIMKNSETGEEKIVNVVAGSEFADATNMMNWSQKLMMGTSREVGLTPQDVTVNLEAGGEQSVEGVTVTETSTGHQITLPASAVLAEVNSEISTFLVNPAALPEGVQVVTQDGTTSTLLVSPEAIQAITAEGRTNLDFPVQGFSPDDDNICTASTVMWLTFSGINPVGIQNYELLEKEIIIYPNPLKHGQILNLEIDNPNRKLETIRVSDLTGKLVYIKKTHQTKKTSINQLNLKAGTYILSVENGEKKSSTKLIVK